MVNFYGCRSVGVPVPISAIRARYSEGLLPMEVSTVWYFSCSTLKESIKKRIIIIDDTLTVANMVQITVSFVSSFVTSAPGKLAGMALSVSRALPRSAAFKSFQFCFASEKSNLSIKIPGALLPSVKNLFYFRRTAFNECQLLVLQCGAFALRFVAHFIY